MNPNEDQIGAVPGINLVLDVQTALRGGDIEVPNPPAEADVYRWVMAVLSHLDWHGEVHLTIRLVEESEIADLNMRYRHKKGPTNVLSFPFDIPDGVHLPLLGDVVVCHSVVAHEAQTQGKSLHQHWEHMVVHGVLHLLGYDHLEEKQAVEMETLEQSILATLGIPDPYGETTDQ